MNMFEKCSKRLPPELIRRDETDAKGRFCVTMESFAVFYGKFTEACATWSER